MTAKAEPKVKASELDSIMSAIEKKLGKGSVHRGDEQEGVHRLPFLSPNLNYATEGGLPIGRFSAFWGGESSFKSRAAYEAIAQAQQLPIAAERALMPRIKLYREDGNERRAKVLSDELEYLRETWPEGMEVVFYNAEMQYDPVWAAKLGIDTHRLRIVESTTIEDIVEAMEASFSVVDMHVVDSTSNASAVEEQGMKKTDRRIGLDARVWKQCLRQAMRHFNKDRNVGLLIHQVSTNMRTSGEQAVSTRFMRHTSSMTLRFRRDRFLYMKNGVLREDKPAGADDASLAGVAEPDGVVLLTEVEKSRVCRPFRKAIIHARYGARQFDHLWELVNAGLYFGIIEQSGSWYKVRGEDENLGQGIIPVRDRISADRDLQGLIYATLMMSIDDEDEVDQKSIPILATDDEIEAHAALVAA